MSTPEATASYCAQACANGIIGVERSTITIWEGKVSREVFCAPQGVLLAIHLTDDDDAVPYCPMKEALTEHPTGFRRTVFNYTQGRCNGLPYYYLAVFSLRVVNGTAGIHDSAPSGSHTQWFE